MDRSSEILKKRRLLLAKNDESTAAGEYQDFLVFSLLPQKYALEIEYLFEVFPLKRITSLPGVPPFFMGIVNVRGKIVDIINLKPFFGIHETGLTELNKVIILREEAKEFGVIADSIEGTLQILPEEILPTPARFQAGQEFVRGMTREGILVLDARIIIHNEQFIIHQ